MIITLDVFSGMPNPTINLNEKDAKKFVERFAGKSVLSPENTEAPLGFRGFIVEASTDVKLPDSIPNRFHVGGVVSSDFKAKALKRPLLTSDENDDAVKWLMTKVRDGVKEDVYNHVKDTIAKRRKTIKKVPPITIQKDTFWIDLKILSHCIIQNTAYNPGFWNNDPHVKANNNCYNYAMNYRSNTFAQPGHKSGQQYVHPPTCTKIKTASNLDGCKSTCFGSNKNVALVIWPGNDYHWYRKHTGGFWGHKPGQTAARNVDNSNKLIDGNILTPFNCDRGGYTIFCSYLFSPTGMTVN